MINMSRIIFGKATKKIIKEKGLELPKQKTDNSERNAHFTKILKEAGKSDYEIQETLKLLGD